MELALQFISNDKTVRKNTVEGLQGFKFQSLATQAKKRRTISLYEASYQKNF